MNLDIVRWSTDRLRVGAWRGDANVAYMAPLLDGALPTTEAIHRACRALAGHGYARVITAALGPIESEVFAAAGFAVHERLHLLTHFLQDLPGPPEPDPGLRRGRRADRDAALSVDTRAFAGFWRLDNTGLEEAFSATPHNRFRVADRDDQVAAYAVSGRSGHRGYLQRLAVDPAHQGAGLGSLLVLDALRWMRRRGADRAMVNTQEQNLAALGLYQRLGFHLEPEGLHVLEADLS